MGQSETSMLDKLQYNNILDDIIGEKIKLGEVKTEDIDVNLILLLVPKL